MALIDCAECGKPVSTQAKACPHCGAPLATTPESPSRASSTSTPKKTLTFQHKAILALVGAAIVLSFANRYIPFRPTVHVPESPAVTTAAPERPVPSGPHHMKISHFGCRTTEQYQEILALADDKAAFQTRLAQRVTLGQSAFFETGDEVITMDVGIWSGMIQVRKRGDPDAFWMRISMIE
jgi:hypothetical protein